MTSDCPRRGPLGKQLVFMSDPQHCDPALRVFDLIRQRAGLLGALPPMGGIIDGMWPVFAHTCTTIPLIPPAAALYQWKPTKMSLRLWPFGRCQRAARALLDLGPETSTRAIMQWAYGDRAPLRARWKQARAVRRACVSLGLIKVGRVRPGGNIWAYPSREG